MYDGRIVATFSKTILSPSISFSHLLRCWGTEQPSFYACEVREEQQVTDWFWFSLILRMWPLGPSLMQEKLSCKSFQ